MLAKSTVKAAAPGVLGVSVLLCGTAIALGHAPAAKADFCSSGIVPTTAWSVCDYPPDEDGSYIHCDTVYVFGIGGRNCYRIFPPEP